jgi:hypothetical protein
VCCSATGCGASGQMSEGEPPHRRTLQAPISMIHGAFFSPRLARAVWPRGGVVTQRTANPCTPVRFRAWPPSYSSYSHKTRLFRCARHRRIARRMRSASAQNRLTNSSTVWRAGRFGRSADARFCKRDPSRARPATKQMSKGRAERPLLLEALGILRCRSGRYRPSPPSYSLTSAP